MAGAVQPRPDGGLTVDTLTVEQELAAVRAENAGLRDQIERLRGAHADQRTLIREQARLVDAAYEPAQTDVCRKVRYTDTDSALEHAVALALIRPGCRYHVYRCPHGCVVPTHRRPVFHVGGGQADRKGNRHAVPGVSAMLNSAGQIDYGCGCVTGGAEFAQVCEAHR